MTYVTTYNPLPISFTHGHGVWLYDEHNNKYLDSFSGIAVCGLGHANSEIAKLISENAAKLMHVSNGFIIPEQELLAKRLVEITGLRQAFFSNSGAEANEAALKLTRLYGHKKNIETPSVIVMDHAFHGRTLATLSASGSRKLQAGYEPLVPGFVRAPFNDIQALKTIALHREDIVAIMLEPIQGEGGIQVPSDNYLSEVAKLCKEKDWLLILDEVQTGNGRTGKWYSFMHNNIQADIITTAKGLGNGYPIGATIIGEKAANLFKPGNHGSTFGGNPLACSVGLKVLEIIERDNLLTLAHENGNYLKTLLQQKLCTFSCVKSIRGKGLMLGIELDSPAEKIKQIALENGLLLNITAQKVIRLLPALNITREEIDVLCVKLVAVFSKFSP